MKKKFKLKWVEEVYFSVVVEAESEDVARDMFFRWGKDVQKCEECGTTVLEESLEVKEVKDEINKSKKCD